MNRVRSGSGWEFLLVKGRPGYTWNPASGCDIQSCAVRKRGACWAEKIVKRLGQFCPLCPSFKPHMHDGDNGTPNRLFDPFRLRKSAIISPVSTGDLFGLPRDMTKEILIYVEKAFWHIFVVLTKAPQNTHCFSPCPDNVWFIVTINEQGDTWRLDELKTIKASVRGAIFEPLYSTIEYDLSWLNWIIIGPQTRPEIQPDSSWVESVLNNAPGVPIFMKSTLKWPWPKVQEFPEVHD